MNINCTHSDPYPRRFFFYLHQSPQSFIPILPRPLKLFSHFRSPGTAVSPHLTNSRAVSRKHSSLVTIYAVHRWRIPCVSAAGDTSIAAQQYNASSFPHDYRMIFPVPQQTLSVCFYLRGEHANLASVPTESGVRSSGRETNWATVDWETDQPGDSQLS